MQIGLVVCRDEIYLKGVIVIDAEPWMDEISREIHDRFTSRHKSSYCVTSVLFLSTNLSRCVATRAEHLEPQRTELMNETLLSFFEDALRSGEQNEIKSD